MFTVTTAEKIETIVETAARAGGSVKEGHGKFGSYSLLVDEHIVVTLDTGERFTVWSDAHGLINVHNVATLFTGVDADLLTACQLATKR